MKKTIKKITFGNNKSYYLIESLQMNNNKYLYLVSENDSVLPNFILVKEYKDKNGNFAYGSMESDEFEMVKKLLAEKVIQNVKNNIYPI